MSSHDLRLGFFPMPYPDEIFYSVLCRYHVRSANPSVYQTNRELWGKNVGVSLLFPSGIERIAEKIPPQANLTAERFITENTIFPFLKPFLPRERAERLFEAMKNGASGHRNMSNLSGFSRLKFARQPNLRYCEACMSADSSAYGEPYWHRLHQLPGIYICPKHQAPLLNSGILTSLLPGGFYPLLPEYQNKEQPAYFAPIAKQLAELADDAIWVLQNGSLMDCYEDTLKRHDVWLRAKGFRGWDGKTWHKKLYPAVVGFYGRDFLTLLDAYDQSIRPWTQRLLQQQNDLIYPAYHLLLMRFLSGSATSFFHDDCEKPLPFGKAPWPCRNKICGYHLQDVIEQIEMKCVKGQYKAIFSCPHCGMIYRRKSAMPKERQYAGQIDVLDYGRLWETRLKEMLSQGKPITVVARALYCDVHTVLKFGVAFGLVPPERLKQRKPYVPQNRPPKRKDEGRAHHRKAWKTAVTMHPEASRSELILLAHKSYEWLRANDLEWFEKNAPAPKKATADWKMRDEEYAELVKAAVTEIKGSPGKPIWANRSAVGRKSGITGLHGKITSGNLPQTAAYLAQALETMTEWRKRKILWAVQTLEEQGKTLTLNKIKLMACISSEAFKPLVPFATISMEKEQ
jgi:hypothetical protein